jgi:hypothetical protein
LVEQGWKDVTDPRDKSGNKTYVNPKTGEKVRYDEGKGKNKGHYHRYNPDSTGPNDRYLDKNGNPVRDGSKPSHLYP